MYIWHYKVTIFGSNEPINIYSRHITTEFIEMLNRKMKNKWYTVEWVGYCNPILNTYSNDGGSFIHWFDGIGTIRNI